MPITPKTRKALNQFWQDCRDGKRVHPAKIYWDEVRAGKRVHPTKKKEKHITNNDIRAPVTNEHLEHLSNNAKPIPFTPEKRVRKRQRRVSSEAHVLPTILERIKIATLQLIEIDSISLRELENTLNSIPECDRLILSLDQLMIRLDRLHNFTSYCRKIHSDTLERLRAHRPI
jgi:hypothetical protein